MSAGSVPEGRLRARPAPSHPGAGSLPPAEAADGVGAAEEKKPQSGLEIFLRTVGLLIVLPFIVLLLAKLLLE
jgi:hypothetical protein